MTPRSEVNFYHRVATYRCFVAKTRRLSKAISTFKLSVCIALNEEYGRRNQNQTFESREKLQIQEWKAIR